MQGEKRVVRRMGKCLDCKKEIDTRFGAKRCYYCKRDKRRKELKEKYKKAKEKGVCYYCGAKRR